MNHRSTLSVATALLLWGCGSDDRAARSDGGTDGGVCGDNLDHVEMLQCLGVDTVLGPLIDPNGNTVREDYNPLTAKRRNLHRPAEIHIAGLGTDGYNEHLWDDESWEVL